MVITNKQRIGNINSSDIRKSDPPHNARRRLLSPTSYDAATANWFGSWIVVLTFLLVSLCLNQSVGNVQVVSPDGNNDAVHVKRPHTPGEMEVSRDVKM